MTTLPILQDLIPNAAAKQRAQQLNLAPGKLGLDPVPPIPAPSLIDLSGMDAGQPSMPPLPPSPRSLVQNGAATNLQTETPPISATIAPQSVTPFTPPALKPLIQTPGDPLMARILHDQGIIQKHDYPDPAKPGFWPKMGRIASRIGNIAGDAVAPSTMALIPGTDLNNQVQYNAAKRDEAATLQQQQAGLDAASRRNLEASQTAHEDAATRQLENPNDWAVLPATNQGLFIRNTKTGELRPLSFNGQPLTPYDRPPQTEDNQLLGDQAGALQKGLEQRWQVLHPGQPLPQNYNISPAMNVGTYKRLDALLSGEEAAQAQQQNHRDAMDNAAATRAAAEAGREQKADASTKQAIYKAYSPSLDSAERFNVMSQNYFDAVKNHDQQAMLSLLANHLGMTMGLQKGARLNRDIIQEAISSRPWLQGIKATFDKDGYLTGVNLTPQQMRQMLDLGRDRFVEDVRRARSEGRYIGSADDGPDREPSKATINFYLSQTNGDVAKAKDLARQDGWTVN